jgi:putative transposase
VRRTVAGYLEQEYRMGERHACRLIGLARSTKRYQARRPEQDAALRQLLKQRAAEHMRYGYRRLLALIRREGYAVNHKRIYRLYREERLAMRVRKRRRMACHGQPVSPMPSRASQRWSMDFVRDCLANGRVIRALTLVDDCTRECPVIEVDTSLSGHRVTRVLDRISAERRLPEEIVVDNGPEFRGRAFTSWCEQHRIRLHHIDKGKPVQNAYVESFNGHFRDECLNANWFVSLRDARRKIEAWRRDYNQYRPHSSLEYAAPAQFAARLSGGVR